MSCSDSISEQHLNIQVTDINLITMKLNTTVGEIPNILTDIGVGEKVKLYNSQRRPIGMGVNYKSPEISVANPNGQVITLCSGNYMLLQNTQILQEIHQAFDANAQLILYEHLGSMFVAVFQPEEQFDGFKPGMLIKNSMNGRDRYGVQPALIKSVCSNGSIIAERGQRVSIWHLERNREMLTDLLTTMMTGMESFITKYSEMNRSFAQEKLTRFLAKLKRKRLNKFLDEYDPSNVQEVYDGITDYASNTLNYNWDLISAASSLVYNPMQLI